MSQLLASTWRRWINALRDPHPIRSHRNPHPASPPSRRQQVTCRLEQLEERALLSGGPPFPNNLTPPALPAPTGNVVQVSTAAQLASAVANLTSGETVLINPGTYNLSDTLYLPQNISNVAIRGATGKSADVVIQGAGMSGNILFGFWAGNVSGVTFADMTIQGFADHGIILNAGVQSPLIHDVHLVDCGQQFIKSNPNPSGGGVNNGVVEYCTIEYSTTAPTYYTNGVDVHTGNNWVIRDNVFRNIRTVGALAGPAVLVWDGSSGAVTEANTFINCQRDIAYGFNDATTNDNTGGIIRNNFIAETTSIGGDVGIYVCNSPNTQVLNNTLWMNSDYPDAIEYRYTDTTGVQVLDNLTNAAIVSRDGGSATLANNITNAPSSWFVNTATGDLHLVATATGAINLVQPLTNVATDYDGQARPYGLLADIGADEYVPTTITDTQAPVVSVTSPAAGAYVRGTVSVTASATDNVGVTGVQFYVDGVAAGSLLTASPYAYAWDTTKLADGTHTLSAKAYDAAGNVGSSASVSVLVDNTAPTVSLTAPAANSTVSGTVSVTASATDNVRVTGVQFYVDGVAAGPLDTTAPYSYSWDTTKLANGTHTLSAKGSDPAGNVGSSQITVTVSNPTAATGLVAAYGFNEGSGTVLHDLSGNGNDGTISNATFTPVGKYGKYGGALLFNGTSSLVTIPDSSTLDLTKGMTLEAWVDPTALSGWSSVLLKEQPGGLSYALYANDGDSNLPSGQINTGGGDLWAVGSSAVPLNKWSYLAATYDGSTLRLYVNGTLVGSQAVSGSMVVSSGALRIGGNSVWGEYFKGLIDEVRVYNRALSAAQIQSDMNTPVSSAGATLSSSSSGTSSSTPGDTQAPVVSVTSPAAGAYVRGTVTVGASATDNVGVTGVQFYVDGVAAGSLLTASPYAYAWDTTKLADGTHTLSAKAYDAAGNVGSSASVSVLVDNTAPTVTAVSPAAGATGANPSGSITVTFSEGVDPTTVNTSTLQLRDASGNLVADTVSYNATSHVATLTPGASLAFSTTYSAVVHGGSAGVKDLAGNALAADYSWSFTTAAQAAAPTANAGPNQTAAEGSPVQFSGSASGGQGSLTYSWAFGDGGTATGTLTPSHVYQEAGNYTATLTVTDGLGRSSQSSAAVTVTEVTPTANAGGPYSAAPGAAMSFTGGATDSPADVSAGLKYSWNFGDGGTSTQQNPSHTYATAGNYTVTLTVTDADGLTASSTASVTVSSQTVAPVTTPTITTPYLTIPNFGAAPTVFSIKSGNWSDPTVWSLGRLPRAGDVVDINPGTTITYDLNDSTDSVALKTVEVQPTATLTFRTDVNTQICVGNFLVLPGGNLIVGTAANPIAANVHANIDIANQAINGVLDPQQFGTGLIVLGNVTMHGAVKTPYATLAVEPRAGDTTLKFASPVSGWQAGDELVVPDTRQLDDSTRGGNYKPQWEQVVVKSVSADGLTVTLSAPLKYDHLGARDANGVLDYLPQVMNLDRNIMVESQSMTGTRGYTLYTGNANVDIEYAGFCELGRTVNAAPSSTNVADRYAMTLLNLIGPATPQANGHQFTLIGNVVDNDGDGNANNPSNIQWGIALNNSYYGLIQSNDVWSVAGVGIGVEDGASSYNVFDRNFVANVTGTSGRTDQQMQGDGFWFHNPNNYVTNNIATDVNAGASDVYSYGFMVNASAGGTGAVGTVAVPAYQGADPSQAGQSKSLNMNATPLLGFSGNEVYGATSRGFSTWWLGTQYETPMGTAGTLKNSVVWNQSNAGYFTYETNGLTIDGFVVRGDASQLSNPFNYTTGIFFGDYMTRNAVVQNVDIQDEATGLAVPSNVGRGGATDVVTFTVQNSYLRNIINIAVPLLESSNGGSGLSARKVIIQNVQFAQPAAALPSGTQPYNIYMDDSRPYDASSYNTTSPTLVYVYGYNDNASDNFQVFFNSTKPANAITRALVYGFVVPM